MSYLNLQSINQEQALDLAKFYMRTGQNMLMLGRRGTGKTHIAMQAIDYIGYKTNYINLSTIERTDLVGLPNMFEKSETITYKSPFFLPLLKDKQKPDTVILFDEIDKAPSELFGPLLEVLQFRKINGRPINVAACILTGNLINEGAYSNTISSALLDRCSKFELQFSFDVWLEWARLNNIHDLILGFLMHNQQMACGDIETSMLASPSPRGWELTSKGIIAAQNNKITDIETITSIVAGYVGEEAAIKLKIWFDYFRSNEQVISVLVESGLYTGKDWRLLETTEQLVFCISACYAAKSKVVKNGGKKRLRYLDNVCRFMIENDVQREIQVVAFSNTFPFEVIAANKLYESRMFFDLVNKLRDGVLIK